mmetsp:Transcript_13365/g.29086  ORF Transcript_13365/g.29086 Transcript_13365/m.29086 type:complete len:250 (-) Transcript_13365:77-826(-)
MSLNTSRIHLPLLKSRNIHLGSLHLKQRRLPQGSLATNLSVHRKTSPLAHSRGLPRLARLQQLHNRLGIQALIIIIIQLNHGSIRTSPKTLHLQQREHAILRSLPILNPQMLLDRLLDILTPANHTRRSPTKLNKVLAHLGPIKHCVERSHLVHARRSRADNLSDLVHGSDGEPSPVLTLGEVKEGDYSGLFVVGGVFGEDFVDAVVVFFGEVEVRFGGVVGGVDVKRLSMPHRTSLSRRGGDNGWEAS